MLALMLAVAVGPAVTFTARNSPYNGLCPATLKFAGTISGRPNATVKYVFNRTIHGVATTSPPVTTALDRNGQLDVTDSFSVTGAQNGMDELQIFPAGAKAAAPFSVTCAVDTAKPNTAVTTHSFLVEKTYRPQYSHPGADRSKCGTDPSTWVSAIRLNLKAAYILEKGNLQEKDGYGGPDTVGFLPQAWDLICIRFDFAIGHYDGQPKSTQFLVTGQHIAGGPMYCVTSDSNMPGNPRVSTNGGPIPSPSACAALPVTQ
jgi:hypothetical protein